jgi:L-asparaginase/Glu-tRNA(Gln) amidotransferase subunit D
MGQGIAVVRATRITEGGVGNNCNEEDEIFGSLPAGILSPQQARVLLILALAANPRGDLRALFRLAGGTSPY